MCSLWLASTALVLWGGPLAGGVSVQPHPLDPLTREELAAAVEILAASGRTNAGSRLALIALREPAKQDVLGFVPGLPVRREAFVVVYERAANRTFEAAIDLGARQVRSWTEIPGVQPAILTEEYALTGDIVRHDARWQAAMRRRGISDLTNVYIDPWPAGEALSPEERNRRIVKAVAYYKASSHNAYARPIEGVIAVVDLTAKRVIRLLDSGVVPLETTPRELDEASLAPQREPPQSLEIVQPHGPSFTIAGSLVRWQKWQFRFGMHPREGLVLYTVAYEDRGRLRPILYRASLSELFVQYTDPSPAWAFRNAFDEGEIDLGRWATRLEPGTDVPTNAVFVSAVIADDKGVPYEIPNALALYERDGGLLWKHVDYPRVNESRRARELVLTWVGNQGNYEYGFNWIFRQDGTLTVEAVLTGIVLPKGVATAGPGRSIALVAPHLAAVPHQHWFNFRLDVDVDGPKNRVVEVDTVPAPGTSGSGFSVKETPLGHEASARRQINPLSSRRWRVINPAARTELGQPAGYALVPGDNVRAYASPDSIVGQRAGFIQAHVWVTAYDPAEMYAAGAYVNQAPRTRGLATWVQANRSIDNRDIVLWYTLGVTHIPRPEDWPVMPVHRASFTLEPDGFFGQNPALDVPKPH